MNKYYIQYHTRTLASLDNRISQQKSQHNSWRFNFPKDDVIMVVNDCIKLKDNIKLHTGLNFIVNIREYSPETAVIRARDYVDTLLNLISFITQTSCDIPEVISWIDATNSSSFPTKLGIFLVESTEIIEPIVAIDYNWLAEIFTLFLNLASSESFRVTTALSWFRKGITERKTVDKFLSFWFGIEVIACLLRDRLQQKTRKPDSWDGIKDVFQRKLNNNDFDDIVEARGVLVHGYKELDNIFAMKLENYLEVMRKGLILAIGEIMGINEDIMKTISAMLPKTTHSATIFHVIGKIENMPDTLECFTEKYPSIQGTLDTHFKIDKNGELDMLSSTITTNLTFDLPSNVVFRVEETQLWRR